MYPIENVISVLHSEDFFEKWSYYLIILFAHKFQGEFLSILKSII